MRGLLTAVNTPPYNSLFQKRLFLGRRTLTFCIRFISTFAPQLRNKMFMTELKNESMTMKNENYAKNAFGVTIKRCCASCRHKSIGWNGVRTCNVLGLKVQHKFKCQSWGMDYGLQKAGMGQGVVRDMLTKKVVID